RAKTGEVIWTWPPASSSNDSPKPPPNAQGGRGSLASPASHITTQNRGDSSGLPDPQGVLVADGKVIFGLSDARVVAVEEKTGKVLWTEQMGEPPPLSGQSVSSAPTYAGGLVFTGMSGGDWALRGKAVALDIKTGRKVWEFYVIPAPGEPGSETWQRDNDEWK